MCDPFSAIAAAGLALSAVGTYTSYTTAENNAAAQAEAAQNQMDYNNKVALMNAEAQNKALARQAESVKEAAAQANIKSQKERIAITGQLLTGAAAGGVTGLSVDQAVVGVYNAESEAQTNINKNLTSELADVQASRLAVEQNLRNAQDAPRPVTIKPDAGAYMLQFGAKAADTAASVYKHGDKKGWWDSKDPTEG